MMYELPPSAPVLSWQDFTMVKAPPIPGDTPSGDLYGLDFANPNDGYALTSAKIATALYATFDGGRSWHQEVIRSDQRVEWITSTPTAFFAVVGTCPNPKASCGGWGLYRTPASASSWTGRSLPMSTRGMEPPQVAAYGSSVWLTGQQQSAPYHALLATSHDSGQTFSVAVKSELMSVNGCSLNPTSPSIVWAQCDGGNMHGGIPLSRDGGVHWISSSSNVTGNFAWGALDPVSRTDAYYVDGLYPARIYRIDVQNEGVAPIGRTPNPDISQLVFTTGSRGLALSGPISVNNRQILYQTSDGGTAWRRVVGSAQS
jgi:photosystem II stability/assembly factor-like uncharacterized protein